MSSLSVEIFGCSDKGAIGVGTGEFILVPETHTALLKSAVGTGELLGAVHFGHAIAYVVKFPWMLRRVLFNFGRY